MKKANDIKLCKKCGRKLPQDYGKKYDLCKHCRLKNIGQLKKIGKHGQKVIGAAVGVAPVLIKVGKKILKK